MTLVIYHQNFPGKVQLLDKPNNPAVGAVRCVKEGELCGGAARGPGLGVQDRGRRAEMGREGGLHYNQCSHDWWGEDAWEKKKRKAGKRHC